MKKMIKEVLIGYVAIAIVILFGLNVYKMYDSQFNKLTHQEMMEMYLEHEFGDRCHGKLLSCEGDEYVEFLVFDDLRDGKQLTNPFYFRYDEFNEVITE